jgi:hypothetical protein
MPKSKVIKVPAAAGVTRKCTAAERRALTAQVMQIGGRLAYPVQLP